MLGVFSRLLLTVLTSVSGTLLKVMLFWGKLAPVLELYTDEPSFSATCTCMRTKLCQPPPACMACRSTKQVHAWPRKQSSSWMVRL